MNGVATKAKKDTRCMECGRTIPAGMTFRRIHDKRGMPIGDHCYGKCKPQVKRSAAGCEQLALEMVDEVDNVSAG